MAKNIEDTPSESRPWSGARIASARFCGRRFRARSAYAANRIPEIADTVVEVDRAMRWGFGWELGPFEVWDAIGVEKSVARMKEEGKAVPANVQQMLDCRREVVLQKERWHSSSISTLLPSKYRAARRSAGHDHSQVSQGSNGRDQEELRRVADRYRRRRRLSRVSFEDECDWRRHACRC